MEVDCAGGWGGFFVVFVVFGGVFVAGGGGWGERSMAAVVRGYWGEKMFAAADSAGARARMGREKSSSGREEMAVCAG